MNGLLDAALEYAARGWRVIPCGPDKHPEINGWQNAATTDPDRIRRLFASRPNDPGVSVVTGPASGLFVLDVDTKDGKVGADTLADLEATHGPLPATYEVITGTGGRHLYFRLPDGLDIRNEASNRLGPDLDIRGLNGQVVAPPSVMGGGRYERELSSPDELADPPAWLIDLLTAEPEPIRPRLPTSRAAGDTPGDRWAAATGWDQLLAADGSLFIGERRDARHGGSYWLITRPGVTDHPGGTLGYGGSDVLKIHSTNWTANGVHLPAGDTYTKFGYYTATRHAGDHNAAARQLAAEGYGTPAPDLRSMVGDGASQPPASSGQAAEEPPLSAIGWEPVDLAHILSGNYEPPTPTLLRRTDNTALIYRSRVNALNGESGGGKSWIAMAACAETILDGGHAIYIDLEDHPASVAARMLALGLTIPQIVNGLTYFSPNYAVTDQAIDLIHHIAAENNTSIVVIDSVGEAMALQGLKQNDDDDVARWFRCLPRSLAAAGPAVILIDHVPKDPNSPTLFAIGSQRKRAAIDGISYRVDTIHSFAKGTDGKLKLVVSKDRGGTFPTGSTAAEAAIGTTPDGTKLTIVFTVPAAPGAPGATVERPTALMEKVSRLLEEGYPKTQRQIRTEITGTRHEAKFRAADCLVAEGYATAEQSRDGANAPIQYRSVKPFRADADAHRSMLETHEMTSTNEVAPVAPSGPRGHQEAVAPVAPGGPKGPRAGGQPSTPDNNTVTPENGGHPKSRLDWLEARLEAGAELTADELAELDASYRGAA